MGASAHADDVTSSLHCLAGLVQTFAHQNGLSLNMKCEVMIASSMCKAEKVSVSIESMNIVAKKSIKCLGFWWSWDLSAKVAIEEAIKKARRAFFMHSSQVFQGSLNPLSGRALFEVCVIPVLLYGCENWILTASLLTKLEHLQGEIGCRILRFTPSHSTLACRIALHWPSMAARILVSKLCYILRLRSLADTGNVAASLFQSSTTSDMSLVRECHFLEDSLGFEGFTTAVLSGDYDGQKKVLKNSILDQDWKTSIGKAKCSPSSRFIGDIASDLSWLCIWDLMLDSGSKGTASLQAFLKIATWPNVEAISSCQMCKESTTAMLHHYITIHLQRTVQDIKEVIESRMPERILAMANQFRI